MRVDKSAEDTQTKYVGHLIPHAMCSMDTYFIPICLPLSEKDVPLKIRIIIKA